MSDRTHRHGVARCLPAVAAMLVSLPLSAAAAEEDLSQPCPRWAVDLEFWSPNNCFGEASGLVVHDVNASGVAVGDETCFGGYQAFWWTEEDGVGYFPFPPGSSSTRALGITDDGLIAGQVGLDGALRGWVYDGTTLTIIDPLPGAIQTVEVKDIAPDGTVIGEMATLNPEVPVAPFRWKDGVLTTIEDPLFRSSVNTFGVTDDEVIYGHYWDADHDPARWQAFLIDGVTVHTLPLPTDATLSDVRGRTSDGTWWGSSQIESSPGDRRFLPILWSDGGYRIVSETPYRDMIFDYAVAPGLFVGRAWDPETLFPWPKIVWDHGVVRLLEDVVEHPDYIENLDVRHAHEGELYLIGNGQPDVHLVSMIAVLTPSVSGDLNCDGLVQFDDLLLMLSAWNRDDANRADLDEDGQIGLGDLQALMKLWS